MTTTTPARHLRVVLFTTMFVATFASCAKRWDDLAPFPCAKDGECPTSFKCITATNTCCKPNDRGDVCNGVDDDCDGEVDNGTASLECAKQQAGSVCRDGACTCALECGGACVDPENDNAHCGGCNQACTFPETCEDGACTCSAGTTRCGADCVRLEEDAGHCGACDIACPTGSTCELGECTCGKGMARCDSLCVDVTSDPDNCGLCGRSCTNGVSIYPVRSNACVASQCRVIEELTTEVNATTSIAVDDNDAAVFLVDYGGVAIKSLDLTTASTPTDRLPSTAMPLPDLAGAAVDSTNIYFFVSTASPSSGYVLASIARTGSTSPKIVATFTAPADAAPRDLFVTQGRHFITLANQSVLRVTPPSTSAQVLGAGIAITDGVDAYLVEGDVVTRYVAANMAQSYLEAVFPPPLLASATNGTIWLAYPTQLGFVSPGVEYSQVETLTSTPTAMAARDNSVFVLTSDRLLRTQGIGTSEIAATSGRELKVTQGYVYWIENNATLLRAPRF